jgi:DNA methylase
VDRAQVIALAPLGPEAALNAICPYYTMFPLSFPLEQLLRARPGEWVLDPFCGRGTTNYAARLLGLPSVGIDSSPVAAAISASKRVQTSPAAVKRALRTILREASPTDLPQGDFWEWCFGRETLRDLCRVRAMLLDDCGSDARIALRALMLGSLHGPVNRGEPSYLSNQMPRTYASKPDYSVEFWRARGMRPPAVDLQAVLERKADRYFGTLPAPVEGAVRRGDSRGYSLGSICELVSWVVTSPPYYGMRTYVPDQWLRHWFLGGPAHVPYVFPGQVSQMSPDDFALELADVWSNVATVCRPGAEMVIRFGGINDRDHDPSEILIESLEQADCGWELMTITKAGVASKERRQARQFLRNLEKPIAESDYYACLAA